MFDIGFWEIFLIGILALLVIGPERLPSAARTMGYWVGRARRYIEGVKNEVEQEFDVTEFKRLMHNQEVQISELQRKLSGKLDEGLLTTSKDGDTPEYRYHDDPVVDSETAGDAIEDKTEDKKDTSST